MSYVMQFWSVPVQQLTDRLRADGLGDIGRPDDDAARAVVAAVEEEATFLDSVQHGSSGGSWFRNELLTDAFGEDLADHLVDRDLAGIVWDEYPSIGWATNEELRAALDGLSDPTDELDEEDAEIVETILAAIRTVLDCGTDLVTVYT
ncbi:hypothetical protein [Prauserella cavernicola]|uniref:DUF1877 family protein n=1 Tax=Prauserella cavernicola TaxID=2800127 RepID=A0A934QZ41_9PSEU|nr:hypothetical protein [Prauserella cavernicola]MBK1789420.1 hypothetical protein [Prauserella cavernicola]